MLANLDKILEILHRQNESLFNFSSFKIYNQLLLSLFPVSTQPFCLYSRGRFLKYRKHVPYIHGTASLAIRVKEMKCPESFGECGCYFFVTISTFCCSVSDFCTNVSALCIRVSAFTSCSLEAGFVFNRRYTSTDMLASLKLGLQALDRPDKVPKNARPSAKYCANASLIYATYFGADCGGVSRPSAMK